MKNCVFVVCTFCFMTNFILAQDQTCQPAKHASLPAITKMTYDAARKSLLAAGWKPLKTVSSKDDPDVSEGNGPIFWQRGYIELEACAGTGLGPCAFLFTDSYKNRLRVTTAGEELPKQKAHAMVTGFRFICE